MKIKILLAIFLLLSSSILSGCGQKSDTSQGSSTSEEKPINLKLGHYFPVEDYRGKTAQYFVDRVKEKSNNTINIDIFPSEQLVKASEGLQSTAQGSVDIYILLTSYMSGLIPAMNVFGWHLPPNEYTDEVMLRFFEENRAIFDDLFDKNGLKLIDVVTTSGSNEYYFNKPIRTFEDFKGVKMRGAGGLGNECMKLSGMSVITLSAAELYLALQTGTVDGCVTTHMSYVNSKLYDVAPYWLHQVTSRVPYMLFMNKNKWEALSENQKKAVIEAAREAREWSFAGFKENEEKLVTEMNKLVKEKIVMEEEEMNKWRQAIVSIDQSYLNQAGEIGSVLLDARKNLFN